MNLTKEVSSKEKIDSDSPSSSDLRNEGSVNTITENHTPLWIGGFTKRQWLLLIIFGFSDFFSAVTISLQAPFYPREAEMKGATPTEYGFVFGIFELTAFIMSPIYGTFMGKIGPKVLFNTGILIAAIGAILFGFLDRIEDKTTFLTFSFLARIVEAIGASAFFTSSFTIIAMEFPTSIATTFASLETFFGLGLIAGPTIGGALFEIGGFQFPFSVLGGLLFFNGILTAILMPKKHIEAESGLNKPTNIFSVLGIPKVMISGFSITVASFGLGYIQATLEPHIRRFNLSPLITGLVFIINGGLYAISAPLWGRFSDKLEEPRYVTLAGSIFIVVGFSLIGPLPFLPFDTVLWVTCLGLLLQGFGIGAIFPSGFVLALRDSMAHGLPDTVGTYALISGLWTSMFAVGAFTGPSVGGFLYDNVGFRNGTLVVIAAQLVLICFLVHFIIQGKKQKTKRNQEATHGSYIEEPLLKSSSLELRHEELIQSTYGSI